MFIFIIMTYTHKNIQFHYGDHIHFDCFRHGEDAKYCLLISLIIKQASFHLVLHELTLLFFYVIIPSSAIR
jgi:hypothetical protein